MEPVVFDQAEDRARGHAHGELWRTEIGELIAIRRALTLERGRFRTADDVETAALAHVPVLETQTPELLEELRGIAEGADRSLAEIVILNHYTDLRDVRPECLGLEPASSSATFESDGCTAMYFNGIGGPVLGQTWDMHATAEPYVRMIRVKPAGKEREAILFTLTGCLGMAGLGDRGVAVTINNLSSTDGQVGLVWPALVRTLLAQPSAEAAYARLLATPLSSGHHYMIADGVTFHGVETSGELKIRTQRGPRAGHIHTNHCFDPVLRSREKIPATSTTFARLNVATTLYAQQRPSTADELWALLGSHEGRPNSICTHQDEARADPNASRTCGRVVMRIADGTIRAARGCSDADDGCEMSLEHYQAPEALAPGALRRPATLPHRGLKEPSPSPRPMPGGNASRGGSDSGLQSQWLSARRSAAESSEHLRWLQSGWTSSGCSRRRGSSAASWRWLGR